MFLEALLQVYQDLFFSFIQARGMEAYSRINNLREAVEQGLGIGLI